MSVDRISNNGSNQDGAPMRDASLPQHGWVLGQRTTLKAGTHWESYGWTPTTKEGEFGILKCPQCGSQPSMCRCTGEKKQAAIKTAIADDNSRRAKPKAANSEKEPKPKSRLDWLTGF